MAAAVRTRNSYAPVSVEDSGQDRLIRAESRTSVTKLRRGLSVWMILLLLIGVCVVFLLGFCLGFYVRESQTDGRVNDILANCGDRDNGRDSDSLTKIHDDIMYRVRGEYIRQFVQNFTWGQHQDPVTGSTEERSLEQRVRQSLQEFALDDLKIEEYDVLLTTCDPARPNTLQVIRKDTNTVINVTLRNDVDGDVTATSHLLTDDFRFPYVVHSPAGVVEGSLVYGHYGSEADLILLEASKVSLGNRIVLLRLGSTSLAEKVQGVAVKGALGVLVYWDPADAHDNVAYPANTSYVPFASAAIYSTELLHPLVPTIPVQTVSTEMAAMLLHHLQEEVGAVAAPSAWSGGLGVGYTMGRRSGGGTLSVRLSTFNKQKHHLVRNIISDIHGTEEKDRYVVIGAPRASLPGVSQDAVTSSALLVQVASSLSAAHQLKQWKPRRGIKMVSWGAADLGNLGMLHFIKAHHHVLSQRAVAYFDVSQLVLGMDVLTAQVSPGLYQVINEVTMTVPDPRRPELSIQSSWQERYQTGQVSDPVTVPLRSYHSDHSAMPFLHALGVTSVSLQYQGNSHSEVSSLTVSTVDDYEDQHHYKFHTAVLRVMVQVLLSMADDDVVPYSLTSAARELASIVWETSDTLEECSKAMQDLENAVTLSKEFQQTAEVFEELIELYKQRDYTQGYRMVNDVKLVFERIFLTHSNGVPHHVLYPLDNTGVVSTIGQLCQAGDFAEVWDAADHFADTLRLVMTEAIAVLRTTN